MVFDRRPIDYASSLEPEAQSEDWRLQTEDLKHALKHIKINSISQLFFVILYPIYARDAHAYARDGAWRLF